MMRISPFEMCVLSSYFNKHMLFFCNIIFIEFNRCKTVTRKWNNVDELHDCNISSRSYSSCPHKGDGIMRQYQHKPAGDVSALYDLKHCIAVIWLQELSVLKFLPLTIQQSIERKQISSIYSMYLSGTAECILWLQSWQWNRGPGLHAHI